jgi:hypothetical protein
MSSGRIEKKTVRPWNTPGLAYLGAFLGIALATAHHIHHVSAGALLLGIVSEIRNRLVTRGD